MHIEGRMHDKTMKDSNAATPVAQPKQEILPPTSKAISLRDITSEEARSLNQGQLIEECRQRAKLVFTSQRRLYSDASSLDVVYEEMVARFRDQNLKGDERDGKPTLKQAFILAGWSYEAARKFHQRYQSWLKKQLITAHENPETLRLTAGDTIKDGDGEYVVKELSDGGTLAVIAKKTEGGEGEKVVAMPLYDSDGIPLFEKVTVSIPTIKVGSLYRFDKDEDGEACRCVGIGKFRVETSVKSLAQEEKEKEAKKKADAEARRVAREAAKAAEAAKRAEISKAKIAAENAARDLADILNKPDVPTKKAKAKAKGKKATKAAKAAAAPPSKTDQPPTTKVGDKSTPTSGTKVVHETIPGGPRVLEVAIPGEFSSDPPRLKYYVCVGDQKHPHPTLDAAKAACDKLAEQHSQKQTARAQSVAQRYRLAERTMGDLRELVVLDGDKVYDCYPLDATQKAQATVDRLNMSVVAEKPQAAMAAD
jgi:hypothetical protein